MFVFLWTPALDQVDTSGHHAHLGMIFGCFMLGIMLGSFLFRYAVECDWTVTRILDRAIQIGAMSLLLPSFLSSRYVGLFAFTVFEVCCGLYFPAVAVLRGRLVEERYRVGIMNWFRVPVNLFAVLSLFAARYVGQSTMLALCFLLLCACYAVHLQLVRMLQNEAVRAEENGRVPEKA